MNKLTHDLAGISAKARGDNDHISGNRIDQAIAYIEDLENRIVKTNLKAAQLYQQLKTQRENA